MDIYRQEILEHYKNPRNFGDLNGFKKKAMDRNASCGDRIEMGIEVKQGRVEKIKFAGEGCAIAMASASILTEMVKGETTEQVKKIGEKEMIKKLGINISLGRKKCATLGLVVLKKLI
jgi:nitrogen fixation NifU-like protein